MRPAGPDPTIATLRPLRSGAVTPGPSRRRVVPLGDEPLETPDGDRPLELAAGARGFARGVAGASERPHERGRLQHQLERLLVEPAADQRHVAVGLDAGRAGIDAGRGAGTLDQGLLRDGLREGDVGRPPGDHPAVPLVRHGHGAGLLALPTARARGQVHETRPAVDLDVETARSIAGDSRDLRVGRDGHVRVVGRRRHLRGRDAAGAVEGREDLAEQDHPAPDARLLLDDEDAVAHVAELERGLHAPDSAADDQDVVVHLGRLQSSRASC